jgi:hypothetical protein
MQPALPNVAIARAVLKQYPALLYVEFRSYHSWSQLCAAANPADTIVIVPARHITRVADEIRMTLPPTVPFRIAIG